MSGSKGYYVKSIESGEWAGRVHLPAMDSEGYFVLVGDSNALINSIMFHLGNGEGGAGPFQIWKDEGDNPEPFGDISRPDTLIIDSFDVDTAAMWTGVDTRPHPPVDDSGSGGGEGEGGIGGEWGRCSAGYHWDDTTSTCTADVVEPPEKNYVVPSWAQQNFWLIVGLAALAIAGALIAYWYHRSTCPPGSGHCPPTPKRTARELAEQGVRIGAKPVKDYPATQRLGDRQAELAADRKAVVQRQREIVKVQKLAGQAPGGLMEKKVKK